MRDHAGSRGVDAGVGELDQPRGEVRVQQDFDYLVERDRAAGAVGAVGGQWEKWRLNASSS